MANGIYMTPVSRFIEIALAVSGLAIVYFMARLFLSRHAWGDGAQYEMLDLPVPAENDTSDAGSEAPPVAPTSGVHRAYQHAAVGAGVKDKGAPQPGEKVFITPGPRSELAAPSSQDDAYERAVEQGLIGLEDRIVRFGFTLALSYLSITWFGMRSLAMWLLALPVLYLLVTALVGKDPIYKWLSLTTELD